MPTMRTVVVESPLAGDYIRNTVYAQLAVLDCLQRGEAPFASHLLYPIVLDDLDPDERKLGMRAGWYLGDRLEAVVLYTDLGVSRGMESGVARALKRGVPVEHRQIPGFAEKIEAALKRVLPMGTDASGTDVFNLARVRGLLDRQP